jgi:hypothetical protein
MLLRLAFTIVLLAPPLAFVDQFIAGDQLTGTTAPAQGNGVGDHTALRVLIPTAVGAVGTGKHASNRIYRAYQGIPYQIRAACSGGDWPYTWSLSSQPTGMTIVSGPATVNGSGNTDGYINWPDPQATDSSITVTCTDRDGDTASATWGITVSTTIGDDGFCFIDNDATNGDTTGTGSLVNPFKTIGRLMDGTDPCARAIVYVRGDTASPYNWTGHSLNAEGGTVPRWAEDAGEPVIFIGYPGDTMPIFDTDDHGSEYNEAYVRGQNIWIEGIHWRGGNRLHMFNLERTGRFGAMIWRNEFTLGGPGVDSSNTAYLFFIRQQASESYWDVVINNLAHGTESGEGWNFSKMYSHISPLYADNDVYDWHTWVSEADGLFSMKDAVQDFTLRNNQCYNIVVQVPCFGGSQNAADLPVRGEVLYNKVLTSGGYALVWNEFGNSTAIYSYNNTYIGKVQVEDVTSDDGPFVFTRDVIATNVASGGSCPQPITCASITSYTPIQVDSSTVHGADNGTIVSTSTGLLQGSYLTLYGPSSAAPRGHALQ